MLPSLSVCHVRPGSSGIRDEVRKKDVLKTLQVRLAAMLQLGTVGLHTTMTKNDVVKEEGRDERKGFDVLFTVAPPSL